MTLTVGLFVVLLAWMFTSAIENMASALRDIAKAIGQNKTIYLKTQDDDNA